MPKKKRKGRGLPHGFESQAQWRLFFAVPRLRKYARKEAHKTARGYHGIPRKKHRGRTARGRR